MKVLVTGANGHLGTNLVAALLAAGHQVRGSVRSIADASRTDHLKALGPVELVEADIEREPSLRAAMDGVEAVMHAAAVYQLYAPGQEAAIIRASVEGVNAAMRAARDAGVRKVVLTSSVVTLPLTAPGARPSTEADWSNDLRVPYIRAKAMGERRAWELANELKVDLVSVLPGAFGGPGFQRNTPTIDLIEAILKGAMELAAPPVNYPYVDVRDVARAHILALEQDKPGRFIAVNDRQPSMTEIAQTMHAIDPAIPAPKLTLPSFLMPVLPLLDAVNSRINRTPRSMTPDLAGTLKGRVWNISNQRIRRELGWAPQVSVKQSLADTIAALRSRR